MPSVFVTATGTEVGKTFVSAGLLRAAIRAGLATDALKPVLTGFAPDRLAGSDAGILLSALGRPIDPANCAQLSPWRFTAPLSPDMAASREGRSLDVDALIERCRSFAGEAASLRDRFSLIEGIGGLMVPLAGTSTVLDLIEATEAPVVLVATGDLGAISHTLCALAALAGRHLQPVHVVINDAGRSDIPLMDTIATLRRYHPKTAFSKLEYCAEESAFDRLLDALLSATNGATSSRGTGSAA